MEFIGETTPSVTLRVTPPSEREPFPKSLPFRGRWHGVSRDGGSRLLNKSQFRRYQAAKERIPDKPRILIWHLHGDSNPSFRRERATS